LLTSLKRFNRQYFPCSEVPQGSSSADPCDAIAGGAEAKGFQPIVHVGPRDLLAFQARLDVGPESFEVERDSTRLGKLPGVGDFC
jgi:hypothetical protein